VPSPAPGHAGERCDVLVVGAGPTGLTLALALAAWGVSVRLVDAAGDRVHESRALGVQPRTLEVLRPLGGATPLVERGNPAVRLRLTAGRRVARVPLFDLGLDDTAFPYLLFVSQAETEAVLAERLAGRGRRAERNMTFESFRHDAEGLRCIVRHADGTPETIRTRWLVGCDGAHSSVRQEAAIPFLGGRYPQTFLLADLPADGLEAGAVNTYLGPAGPLFFFPLERPAPWRLITMRPRSREDEQPAAVTLAELQAAADMSTGGAVRLGQPVWTNAFRVHHRGAVRYRNGRVFLAGDAAHVHSPAGAQGMNTGIQDAVNLAWKLALVLRGAPEALLDSYDAERRPVGEFVLRFTDRAFTAATSQRALLRFVRSRLVPHVLPWALRPRIGRRWAFRTVSELGISYRHSPQVERGRGGPGPQPGDRLPDARVLRAGADLWLQQATGGTAFCLLLCGPPEGWDAPAVAHLAERFAPFLVVHRLSPDRPGAERTADLVDRDGALHRLGVRQYTHFVVRPDGHIGYRADDADLAGAQLYLARWLPPGRARGTEDEGERPPRLEAGTATP
jgi:2-polyprenyl-6-methoxyphenol hydroxylase-like FAD-dependent oxidoreductase